MGARDYGDSGGRNAAPVFPQSRSSQPSSNLWSETLQTPVDFRQSMNSPIKIDDSGQQVEKIHRSQPVGEFLFGAQVVPGIEQDPGDVLPNIKAIFAVPVDTSAAAARGLEISVEGTKVTVIGVTIFQAISISFIIDTDIRAHLITPFHAIELPQRDHLI